MNQAVVNDCEHHFESRVRGGHPLYVRLCTLCRAIDWADLDRQAGELRAAAASAVVSPPTDRAELRDRIADAIRAAACPGDCGKTEEECARERIQPFVWHHGKLAGVEGSPEQFADAVLAVLGEQTDRAAVLREAADALGRMDYDTDSNDYGYDTYRDAWNGGVMDAAALLRRLAVEAHDTGTQQPEAESGCGHCSGVGWPRIKGNCPACRRASLFLGTGGYPTCSNHECPEPDAATTVLEQYANEAHEPEHTWKVESPRRDQWASWGATYDDREWARERYEDATRNAPARRFRLVRATTTYTVEEPAPVAQQAAAAEHTGGNAEDCPVCRPEIDKTVLYPWICTGEQQAAAADGEETRS